MSQKKIKKDGTRYFKQTDTLRLLGGGIAIVGLVWFYFGMTYASYILPTIFTPIGVVMFILGSSRHISDSDMEEEIQKAMLNYDAWVTERADFDRLVLKHPVAVESTAYQMTSPATYFKRGKNSVPMSDICVKSHFFFTKDALLVCSRMLSITQMHEPEGGVLNKELALYFADMTKAEICERVIDVTLSNTKKVLRVKQYDLVIYGTDGEILRLPVHNDMDTSDLCDDINRRIQETTK